jgi:hypothetical protein
MFSRRQTCSNKRNLLVKVGKWGQAFKLLIDPHFACRDMVSTYRPDRQVLGRLDRANCVTRFAAHLADSNPVIPFVRRLLDMLFIRSVT